LSRTEDPGEPEIDEVSSRLAEGLKSCRAILSNYRAAISDGKEGGPAGERHAGSEEGEEERCSGER
jgi:hypothetical protein